MRVLRDRELRHKGEREQGDTHGGSFGSSARALRLRQSTSLVSEVPQHLRCTSQGGNKEKETRKIEGKKWIKQILLEQLNQLHSISEELQDDFKNPVEDMSDWFHKIEKAIWGCLSMEENIIEILIEMQKRTI